MAESLGAQPVNLPYRAFYFSIAAGGSYLSVNDVIANGPYTTLGIKGSAFPVDLKIGYAFEENLIVHGDLISINSISVDVTADGHPIGTISGDNSASMIIFGAGCTYYFLPSDFFISGTLGGSSFTINKVNSSESTDIGFGLNAKLGKEWRISRKWNIGISMGISYAKVNNEADYMTEKLNGTSLGLLLNASRY